MSKLIVFPLVILLGVSVFNIVFAGGEFGIESMRLPNDQYWYDGNGVAVCDNNYTAVGQAGTLVINDHGQGFWVYDNGTATAVFQSDGSTTPPLYGNAKDLGWSLNMFIGAVPIGFLALIFAGMALALFLGVKVFGSGWTDVGVAVLVRGTMYVSVFLMCASMSVVPIMSIPLFGTVIFLFLTGFYTFGILSEGLGL